MDQVWNDERIEKVLRNEDELVKLRLRNTELDDYIRRENLRPLAYRRKNKRILNKFYETSSDVSWKLIHRR